MTTVPIRIILQGLIALFPQTDPSGSQTMTALLVNARDKPAGMVCFAEHTPKIRFPTSASDCRKCPGSDYDQGFCSCTLSRHEIAILPQPSPGTSTFSNDGPHRSLPFNAEEAASFAYVANLSRLGYVLDPSVKPGSTLTPIQALAARFSFPFKSVASCGLATRRDEVADYVHPLSMRALGEEEHTTDMIQAMARQVEATTQVDVDTSVPMALKLRLTLFPGEAPDARYPLDFELPTNLKEVDIFLSNERMTLNPDDMCDDGIGRDFAFFYNLADASQSSGPLDWNLRKLPHVKYSLSKSAMDLSLPPSSLQCLPPGKATMSRPICPMASY